MGEDEFEKFFDSITPAGSYDAHDPTHRALRYTQEIAWRAGREQGMREAAAICKGKADWIMGRQEGPQEELSNVIVRHHASAHLAAHDAILAAIGEGK